jgi:hypothetical protein
VLKDILANIKNTGAAIVFGICEPTFDDGALIFCLIGMILGTSFPLGLTACLLYPMYAMYISMSICFLTLGHLDELKLVVDNAAWKVVTIISFASALQSFRGWMIINAGWAVGFVLGLVLRTAFNL